jgi:uncharacterized membrane protein YhaH (DUF805 family)/uncharacterized protein YndB with AHSA1/START domain
VETLRLLFGLSARVTRRAYVTWGLALGVLKFALDTLVVYAFTGKVWSPLGYVVPSMVLREGMVGRGPEAMHVLLPVLALPFLWIGVSMSVRRAADAGVPPWRGMFFLVPVVNYVAILLLSLLPSAPNTTWQPLGPGPYRETQPPRSTSAPPPAIPPGARAALLGIVVSTAIGLMMIGLSVYGLGLYGLALFFVTPFTMGAASAAIYNNEEPRRITSTLGVAAASVLLAGSATLLFAIEGLLCLVMAAPIALVLALLGALIGRAVVTVGRGDVRPAMLLFLPGLALGERAIVAPAPRDVVTAIEIDAPPEKVWPNVVGFSDLEEPPEWFFNLGIAYPKRARIDGEGVGAVRRCEFSTGPFVEPITAWSPPERLAFDVTSEPPSMTEWSPYGAIHTPHLEGYMSSKGGEFRLVRLSGGRTRLEGTTHYTIAIYPELYWVPYAEALLHAIHWRVLRHIKHLSEAPAA